MQEAKPLNKQKLNKQKGDFDGEKKYSNDSVYHHCWRDCRQRSLYLTIMPMGFLI